MTKLQQPHSIMTSILVVHGIGAGTRLRRTSTFGVRRSKNRASSCYQNPHHFNLSLTATRTSKVVWDSDVVEAQDNNLVARRDNLMTLQLPGSLNSLTSELTMSRMAYTPPTGVALISARVGRTAAARVPLREPVALRIGASLTSAPNVYPQTMAGINAHLLDTLCSSTTASQPERHQRRW